MRWSRAATDCSAATVKITDLHTQRVRNTADSLLRAMKRPLTGHHDRVFVAVDCRFWNRSFFLVDLSWPREVQLDRRRMRYWTVFAWLRNIETSSGYAASAH